MSFNHIGLSTASHTTGLGSSVGFQSPRKAKPVEDDVLADKPTIADDTDAVLPKETKKASGDTVHFSKKHKAEDGATDEAAAEPIEDAPSVSKLSAKQLAKAELKKERVQQELWHEEIHKGKVAASWWGSVPFIGPAIGLLSNVFANPEKRAEKRDDVKAGYVTKEAGIEQEQKIKAAKLKAAFVTAVPQLVGLAILVGGMLLNENIRNTYIKLIKDKDFSFMEKIAGCIAIPFFGIKEHFISCGVAIASGTACILAPLGYTLGEKAYNENFNKGL
jgi:hypothetical protein